MYSIKKKLQNGEMVLGTIISEVRNPNIAYMLAQCGFEFFIVDRPAGGLDESGIYSNTFVDRKPLLVELFQKQAVNFYHGFFRKSAAEA